MEGCTPCVVKMGKKYLHMSITKGVTWGPRAGAFIFTSTDAAAQIAWALTPTTATIGIEFCKED